MEKPDYVCFGYPIWTRKILVFQIKNDIAIKAKDFPCLNWISTPLLSRLLFYRLTWSLVTMMPASDHSTAPPKAVKKRCKSNT